MQPLNELPGKMTTIGKILIFLSKEMLNRKPLIRNAESLTVSLMIRVLESEI